MLLVRIALDSSWTSHATTFRQAIRAANENPSIARSTGTSRGLQTANPLKGICKAATAFGAAESSRHLAAFVLYTHSGGQDVRGTMP
jgi:hypothetical protein